MATWTPRTHFENAAQYVQSLPKSEDTGPGGKKVSSDVEKLRCYALYKQATLGLCSSKRPSMMHPLDRLKYDVYKGLGDLPVEDAKDTYVETIALKSMIEYRSPKGKEHTDATLAGDTPSPFLVAVFDKNTGPNTTPAWEQFADAAGWVQQQAAGAISSEDAVALEGMFNQVMFGDNFMEKPGLMGNLAAAAGMGIARPEWDAWTAMKGKTKDAAILEYCTKVEDVKGKVGVTASPAK